MEDVTGLFVLVLTLLLGRSGGIEPSSGYCIGTQCFSVFHHISDFHVARIQCRNQGGHLMTVRSSVSQDVLHILLGNSTNSFWIGLHLTGCPDPAAELRGFQWVTKDNESDFFNWKQSVDSDCASPHCVSVSQRDNFKWSLEPCVEVLSGFLCEYGFSQPCRGLSAAQGESVLYKTPMGFEAEDLLSLPPGSIAVRLPAESKYVCFSESWLLAPWSCEIQEGGCEYRCADPDQVPVCYCPPGQAVNPANKVTCEVSIDDECRALRCQHACYKTGDAYACMCDHGFKLAPDGKSCVDFNDCVDERQCPEENTKCVNSIGGFKCVCKDGYTGSACVDMDECVNAPCEHECVNTPGSYRCECFEGYQPDPENPEKCKLHCGREECPAECDPNNPFQCYCPDGYLAEERGEHTICIDIDECMFLYCDQGCRNTFGSYVCSCQRGYMLVGQYKCVKNDDDPDTEEPEGSADTTPNIPTWSATTPPTPSKRPSGVPVWALVVIIVCTVVFIVLVVFLVHHVCNGSGQKESGGGALKAPETHSLHHVTSDTSIN